jgi:Polyketide cyclase / dehydrase and lipid transport
MILRIIIVAAVLIAVVLVFAAMKPSTFHLQPSITIKAPTEKIFPLVNDFHNWSTWEPQDKGDNGIQRTYSGPTAGVKGDVRVAGQWQHRQRPHVDHRSGSEQQGFCCGGFRKAVSGS